MMILVDWDLIVKVSMSIAKCAMFIALHSISSSIDDPIAWYGEAT